MNLLDTNEGVALVWGVAWFVVFPLVMRSHRRAVARTSDRPDRRVPARRVTGRQGSVESHDTERGW